jgi:hypothetical protein
MMQMGWEGLTVTPEGVVIGGDELRPGSAHHNADGGAIFKFVPTTPATAGKTISSLEDSPLADGSLWALTVSCVDFESSSFPQVGQGCEVGDAAWVELSDSRLMRQEADSVGATGYYRPEDLHVDPVYDGEGIRFCWTNTGNEGAHNCKIDIEALDRSSKFMMTHLPPGSFLLQSPRSCAQPTAIPLVMLPRLMMERAT